MSFKVGLQRITVQSIMEAELVVPKAATREAVYLTNLMGELGF